MNHICLCWSLTWLSELSNCSYRWVIVGSDQPPLYPKPPVPYSTANSSRSSHGGTAPSSSRSAAAAGSSPHAENDATRQNPLAAFDPRDVSLITITTTTTTTTTIVVVVVVVVLRTCGHFTYCF